MQVDHDEVRSLTSDIDNNHHYNSSHRKRKSVFSDIKDIDNNIQVLKRRRSSVVSNDSQLANVLRQASFLSARSRKRSMDKDEDDQRKESD